MRKAKEFEELGDPITLSVFTKCPEKWVLLDSETGQLYKGTKRGYWDRLDPVIKQGEDNG